MVRRLAVIICVVVACLALGTCRKLPSSAPANPELSFESLKSNDAIPVEYGNLVAVTTENQYPNWAQLWFEKPDKTIVVVKVNWADGVINPKATIIPRR